MKAARAAILAMANYLNGLDLDAPTFSGFVTMQGGQALGTLFQNPSDGSTVAMDAATRLYVHIAVGTKAAVTFDLPASPVNGQVVRFCTDGEITTPTFRDSAGNASNVLNAPTKLLSGGRCEFVYRSTTGKWYRCG